MDAEVFGAHGFDNRLSNMRPIFIAHGPGVRPGSRVPPFDQVDLYNLITSLAGLKPLPNNGSWDNIAELINEAAPSGIPPLWVLVMMVGILRNFTSW